MATIILGIDPALRNTGWGVLSCDGRSIRALGYGVIRNKPSLSQALCLVEIRRAMLEVIHEYAPQVVSVEGVIYLQNFQTAITMGAARGAALMACAEERLPIHEYAPKRVKSATVGFGGAQKGQVGFMIRSLLGLTETPPADAADALAVAMTHAQNLNGLVESRRLS